MATTHEPKYSRREPDATVFAPVIAEFLAAIHIDPELSIAMAKNATAIAWKRAVWDCRRQLRDAARAAMATCSQRPEFLCEVKGACGTSSCPFARPEHAEVLDGQEHQPPRNAKTGWMERPQPHIDGPTFDLEPSIQMLARSRAGLPTAT